MGIFADLAALRPGVPVDSLQRRLAPGANPVADGWLNTTAVKIRVDGAARVSALRFERDFPSNVPIEALTIGMTLDALAQDPRDFRPLPRRFPLANTPYVAATRAGDTIAAHVSREGDVVGVDITRPGDPFPDGAHGHAAIHPISLRGYTDNAELLADWAGGDALDTDHARRLADAHWLRNDATPDDRHAYVANHNWDDGLAPLLWIVRQPDCETATALLAFFMSRPGQFLDYADNRGNAPGWASETLDLILEIRDRFLAGAYAASSVAFDAGTALQNEAYLPKDPDPVAFDRLIPPPMRRAIPGRTVNPNRGPARPLRPELFARPVSVLRPPPLTEEEQGELARARTAATARRRRPR